MCICSVINKYVHMKLTKMLPLFSRIDFKLKSIRYIMKKKKVQSPKKIYYHLKNYSTISYLSFIQITFISEVKIQTLFLYNNLLSPRGLSPP